MSKFVSVIIPSYNHDRYLPYAVKSVLEQSHDNLELIIVDDGSQDGSIDYLSDLREDRVRCVLQSNRGAHAAINRGIAESSGEFIAILNSDDIYETNRIAKALNIFQENEQISLVTSWLSVIDESGAKLGVKRAWENLEPWPVLDPTKCYKATNSFSLNLLMSNFVATTSNIIVRRETAIRVGGMRNLRFTHDWDFLLRVAAREKCYLIQEPLLQYRIHRQNTIASNRAWMLFEICWIWAVHLRNFATFGATEGMVCSDGLVTEMERIDASINPQGYDRIIWELMLFIDAQVRRGKINPEELLLEDATLREFFIQRIREKEQVVALPVTQRNYSRQIRSVMRKFAGILVTSLAMRRIRS